MYAEQSLYDATLADATSIALTTKLFSLHLIQRALFHILYTYIGNIALPCMTVLLMYIVHVVSMCLSCSLAFVES